MDNVDLRIESLGEIAQRLDVPIHRVEYIIRSRQIQPTIIAGGRNFYDEFVAQRIAGDLRRIAEERGVGHAAR